MTELCHLLQLKDRGGLMTPSAGVVKVCLTAEEELRRWSSQQGSAQGAMKRRWLQSASVTRTCCSWDGMHSSPSTVWATTTPISSACWSACTTKYHQARLHTAEVQKDSLRQRLNKTVLFKGF